MASAFLSSILSKTSQVLGFARRLAVSPSSSSDPRSSVLKDLKKLEKTLKRIQAVLHDAEEREIRDESVKLWLKELKEVAYDADDVLDEYQYEILRAQVEGRASGRKRKRVEGNDEKEVSIPDGMGDRIKEIRERFDEISQDRERLRLREEDGERRVLKAPYPAPTSHMVDESSVYGREHDKQEVIDLLLSEGVGNGVSVIPIVGKGGLGKTTIAQLVYNDSKVKKYFDLTGWVCVSDDFDVPKLTKAILESLTQSSCDLTQLSTLQDSLKEKLKGKRVLLVLDDVWNDQQSHWERVLLPFVRTKTVRIIVTCRNHSVVDTMQTVHPYHLTVRPYHPGCLSPEQSWALFGHYAFGGRDREEQPRLADIGKQIVQKCSGLPLAVKSIGSLLRYTIDEDSWMDVIQSDAWEVNENNEILPALRLSYSRMPGHLKPCFVYCSMFPKDYVFDKDELVRLWMAQSYIQTCGDRRTMEDIGNEYFNDLQRRSFFDSYCSKFKMHDMIHNLAKSIAENECWAIGDKKLHGVPDEVRHLYVKDKMKFEKSLCSYNFRDLRTLLLRHQYRDQIVIPKIIKNLPLLRCLRTLEFCLERKDKIPDVLGNLKHLRYLHIKSKKIEKLPESICLLYHLQTLVFECWNLAKLPDSLGNLTNLHHLQIVSNVNLCLPARIGKLTKLQSFLGCYKVQGGIGVLKDLVNLQGILIISGLRNVVNREDARDAGLKYKYKIDKLELDWNVFDCKNSLRHNRLLHLEVFPEENKDVLVDEKREEAILEYLQPHANLKVLSIKSYGGSKFPEWVGNPFSFASLQEIDIMDCEKIRSLPLYIHNSLGNLDTPISSMLERVYIFGCRQLTSIVGLHHLHSLKDLNICNCPQLQLLSAEGLPSNVQYLQIEECQQFTSLSEMQNLTSLEELTIKNCPQKRLPSKLKCLHIEECQQSTSVLGMQNCPKLHIMAEDQFSSVPFKVQIINCPGLSYWCQIQRINCIWVASGNKLTISNTWENIMSGFVDLTSVEHLCYSNYWELFRPTQKNIMQRFDDSTTYEHIYFDNDWKFLMPRFDDLTSVEDLYFNDSREPFRRSDSIPVLEELTIWGCTKIPPLRCLPKLTSLQSLVIKDCPRVRFLQDELQRPTLKSLVVDSCEDLMFLCLARQNRDALEELQLVNCPKLELVEGLNCLFLTKILRIERCPRLKLLQDDLPGRISLRSLVIKDCPGVRLLQDRLLPSTLKSLVVDSCEDLTFLRLAQQNRYAFEELQLVNCPKLERVDGLNCLFLTKILRIERCPRLRLIVDCPGLSYWCQIQRINCIEVASGSKLTISNTWENIMHGFADLTFVEHLCYSNSWELFLRRDSIPILEELTIWGCTDIPPLRCLPKLASLRSLVIKDCPGFQFLEDKLLPSTLESLVVENCEDLMFLLLAQQNRDTFEELQLVNCPKLIWVEGLNCVFFPKILRIERCPQLQLPQDD